MASHTGTLIIFAKLQSNLLIKQPLNSSQSAHIYQKEAGSDCRELPTEEVKEEIKVSLRLDDTVDIDIHAVLMTAGFSQTV